MQLCGGLYSCRSIVLGHNVYDGSRCRASSLLALLLVRQVRLLGRIRICLLLGWPFVLRRALILRATDSLLTL